MTKSAAIVLITTSLLASCDGATGPRPLRGTFALTSLYGRPLPVSDGGSLLLGDSLDFNTPRPASHGAMRTLATVVYRNSDGSTSVLRGYQTYERRGDSVITSFFCRFSALCPAVVIPPEVGLLRNDSLIFTSSLTGPSRTYRRVP